eukprot:TRINITY_DN13158_c0_g1_i1.p1 TRINITY_DN13158_c0_g1~~TRINITY_DN13158_c0_g1_i1.p1  ORF type:complete len:299 (+),score=99.25 TRINITY_DN13158_c0_g1_i1:22-897(+)
MSDYEAYFIRHQKLDEIRERYTKKDEEEDDVDYFQKKRIQRDAMRERQREAELAYHKREADLRANIGYSTWAERKDEERQKKIQASRGFDLSKAEQELEKKKLERELRREDIRAMTQRHEEMAELKARWEMEDKARAIARAEEEVYRRGQEWSRRDSQLSAIRRERERYREERRLREEEHAVQEHIRAREWQMKQEQDAFDHREWAKVQERRKKKEDRAVIKAALGVDTHASDPYAEAMFRETERRRKNWDGYKRRLEDSEHQFEDLKKWYTNRSLDRAERTHRNARNTTF